MPKVENIEISCCKCNAKINVDPKNYHSIFYCASLLDLVNPKRRPWKNVNGLIFCPKHYVREALIVDGKEFPESEISKYKSKMWEEFAAVVKEAL